jgi:hypothetical protein
LAEFQGEKNVVWANTSIIGCTRFDWDNKEKSFSVLQQAEQVSLSDDGTAHVTAYKNPSQLFSSGEDRWYRSGGNRHWADDWCKTYFKEAPPK